MKKIGLIIALLLISLSAFADRLSEREAQKIAARFFTDGVETKSEPTMKLAMVGGPKDAPSFYAFNREGGGFVIVSSDTRYEPVLGYSFENTFKSENMPANVAHWMAMIAEGAANQPAVKAVYGPSVHKVIRFLNTAKWDQDAPYNNLCPDVSGRGRAVTGCTNTATATIMYYHKWPAAGHGDLPEYSYTISGRHCTIPGHSLGHPYEWDKMLYTYNAGRYTEEEGNAVAVLMYDVGVMNQAYYDSPNNGTGTAVVIDETLPKYMDYDNGIRLIERSWYSDAEWCRILKKEIDENRPLMYCNDEHAFVVDGYDSADYFAINFGWSGTNDGYYPVSIHNFTRNDNLHYVSDTRNNVAVIGIKPRTGGTPVKDFLVYEAKYSDPDAFRFGGETTCTAQFGPLKGTFSGELRMALVDKDKKIKSFVSDSYSISSTITAGRVVRYAFKCKGDVSSMKATDFIAVCYKYASDSEWTVSTNHLLPVAPTRFLVTKSDGYRAGETFSFVLSEGGNYYNVLFYFDDKEIDKGADISLTSGKHTVKAVVYSDKNVIERTVVQVIEVK